MAGSSGTDEIKTDFDEGHLSCVRLTGDPTPATPLGRENDFPRIALQNFSHISLLDSAPDAGRTAFALRQPHKRKSVANYRFTAHFSALSSSTLLLGSASPGGVTSAILRFALGEMTEPGHQTMEDQTRRAPGVPGVLVRGTQRHRNQIAELADDAHNAI
jgi:hypothetical protein